MLSLITPVISTKISYHPCPNFNRSNSTVSYKPNIRKISYASNKINGHQNIQNLQIPKTEIDVKILSQNCFFKDNVKEKSFKLENLCIPTAKTINVQKSFHNVPLVQILSRQYHTNSNRKNNSNHNNNNSKNKNNSKNNNKNEMFNVEQMNFDEEDEYFESKTKPVARENRFFSKLENEQNKLKGSTNIELINAEQNDNYGLRRFMNKVYTTMGYGVGLSVFTSLIASPLVMINPFLPLGIGAVLGLGGCYFVTSKKPNFVQITNPITKKSIWEAEDSAERNLSYYTMTTGMGLVMSPLISMVSMPVVVGSLAVSGVIFGGCAVYSLRCNDVQMMKWKAPLSIGLVSLIGLQITGILSMLAFGPNPYSEIVNNVDIYAGIGLFTAMSIYDSYIIRKMYSENYPDHLLCASKLYLDFINLWTRILEAYLKTQKK